MPMYYRNSNGRLKPWVTDLDFESGGKITGAVPVMQNTIETIAQYLSGIKYSDTPGSSWFDREKSATVVDISKWNGDIVWNTLWQESDGCIGRLGYGAIQDQRFLNSTLPGFKLKSSAAHYKGLYHYMNTGVNLDMQINLILQSLDKMGDHVQAFWTDIEHAYNDPDSAMFRDNPLKIMRAVRHEFPHLKVGFYTNYQGWIDLGMPTEWLDEFLFWYAWYPYDHTLRMPKVPPKLRMEDIYLWQYWADGNGQGSKYGCASRAIDICISRDARAEFILENSLEYGEGGVIIMPTVDKELQLRNEQELLLGSVKMHSDNMIDIAMDIEPEPVLLPMYQATVTAPLSVRTGPSTGYNKVETLPQGSDVTVWVESQGVNYLWAKISLTEELWVATNWLIED